MIKLIVLDVDGTMTDGKITYTSNNAEIKSFNVKDGLAITSWLKLGKEVAIITGRKSEILEKRADELNIKYLYQKVDNKKDVLNTLIGELNITMDNVASIGDDLNDLDMLKNSKLAFVPNDANPYLDEITVMRLDKNGGDGVVAQMIEYLVEKENLKERYIKLWSE